MQAGNERETPGKAPAGGLAGWLLKRLRVSARPRPRLELVERITLAPKHSLALVEAEGRRFLVATSTEGSPVFYALDEQTRGGGTSGCRHIGRDTAARVSW